MDDITDPDYTHEKRVCKDFKIKKKKKKIGENHDLYYWSNSLLSADVLEKFRNMSLEIYEIDTALFHSISGLPWQVVG